MLSVFCLGLGNPNLASSPAIVIPSRKPFLIPTPQESFLYTDSVFLNATIADVFGTTNRCFRKLATA